MTKSTGTVPAPLDAFKYAVSEGQTEKEYRRLLDRTNRRFAAAEKDFVSFNAKRLVMLWDAGHDWSEFLSKKKNDRGQISEKDVADVASDLAPFSTGQRVTKEILRICLRVLETYDKDRIAELAKLGINENHVSVFLQVEDPKVRKTLEDRTIKENLNGEAIRKVVREMAKDPAQAGAIKGASRARYKQEASKKKNQRKTRIDQPLKMIDYMLVKFEADADDLTDLTLSLGNVEKLEPGDKSALTQPLGDLLTRLSGLVNTFNALKDVAFTAQMTAKQALATEGKTQGVKGAGAVLGGKTPKKTPKKTTKKTTKKPSGGRK